MRHRAYAAAIVLACAASLLAQDPATIAPTQAPDPTFRSGVDLAHIDVIVTDEDGDPVTGLTADDFEVLENGERRQITAFEAVALPVAPSPAPLIAAGLEPDVASNERMPDRVYMFALDEVSPCNALRTRHFLRQFLDSYFGSNDVADDRND